ncbi:hypothetical protein AXG93_3426s1070 [Marchantia polymorpha subsp. ruderalis]|uniref:ABC transporter domain-containing protein n=1 Tax=Marchantia polymorpha subsp. ruderalis TaxID=1480154 RepID=A0A176VC29_MARPO|nr:hypothetical protein AXG93_3426s1070 [Marchantia polymorpha subsp. ruderalis]
METKTEDEEKKPPSDPFGIIPSQSIPQESRRPPRPSASNLRTLRRASLDSAQALVNRGQAGRSNSDAAADEAHYFAHKLQEWYDRNQSVDFDSNPAAKQKWLQTIKPTDEKGKSPALEAISAQETTSPAATSSPPHTEVSDMKEKVSALSKEELVDLVLLYYHELVGLGRTQDATRVLQSAIEHVSIQRPVVEGQKTGETGIDKLLNDGLLKFLLKLNKYLPPLPAQVIKFKDVSYFTNVNEAKEGYETVGSMSLKLFLPCIGNRAPPSKFSILQDCTGYLMPGTLTLVCGPPGCGKSSLHKAIAGRLQVDKRTFLNGRVTYNGKGLEEIQPRRVAAYIAQTDRHLPTLSVRETVDFAYKCTSLFPQESAKNSEAVKIVKELGGADLPLELILHLLGLRAVADSAVGSATVRGVSGGERHRVTTAEMVVGTFAVLLLDEISTGLDSSATFDIVSALRTMARVRQITCLLSLLQPSPEVFDMFDRVIVLNEGCIIYQGPKEDVIPYFAELGYAKPKHVDVADFLQEITTSDGVHFVQPGFLPLTHEEFHAAYLRSEMHADVERIVNNPKTIQELWVQSEKPLGLKLHDQFGARPGEKNAVEVFEVEPTGTVATADIQQTSRVKAGDVITGVVGPNGKLEYVSGSAEEFVAEDVVQKVMDTQGTVRLQLERVLEEQNNARTLFQSEYVQDWKTSAKTVFKRQSKLAIRNTIFVIARNVQVLIIAIFTGTLFFKVSSSHQQTAMDLKKSLAFLACMALSLNTVFEKQYAARFFRPQSYVLAGSLSGIPYTILETIIYCPLLYWLTGLSGAQQGRHFILYVLIVFVSALAGAALVRLIVSVSGTREGATGLAGLSIVLFLLFAGFLITVNKVPDWWIWMYYLSPLQWGVTALICNEFLSGKYDMPCSAELDYCLPRMHLKVGQAYLDLYGFPTAFLRGVWIPVIILAGYYVFFTCLTFVTVSMLRFEEVKLPSAARLRAAKMKALRLAALQKDPQAPPSDPQMHLKSGAAKEAITMDSAVKFVPMILSFHKITYEVNVPGARDPRLLLAGVSGYARPGTLTALMGSSGAGKTTLLDVLAGRKTMGRITGEILLNGYPKVPDTFARIAGYVEQNDIHTPFISVRESLVFSASLRLPSTANRLQFVKEVMDVLELGEISDKLVGVIGDSGLSVEEAKRLTIGVELVSNPSILFLDEPTSGLDSRAAQIVMRSITSIVKTGRTVICTIHQPSRRLFLAFDHLLLLKRGGRTVYFGPIGKDAEDLLAYFQSLPGVHECGENQNPASYMLEIIGAGIGHSANRDFAIDYSMSSLNQVNVELLETYRFGKGNLGPEPSVKGYAATFWLMFVTVTTRQFKTYWRNIAYSVLLNIKLACLVEHVQGLLLSLEKEQSCLLEFWKNDVVCYPRTTARKCVLAGAVQNHPLVVIKIKYDTTPGMISRLGLIYLSIVFVAITNANNVIPQIPYLCISTLIFCAICFSMAGVATTSAKVFFEYWFIFFEYAASITFFGIFVAMLTPNAEEHDFRLHDPEKRNSQFLDMAVLDKSHHVRTQLLELHRFLLRYIQPSVQFLHD